MISATPPDAGPGDTAFGAAGSAMVELLAADALPTKPMTDTNAVQLVNRMRRMVNKVDCVCITSSPVFGFYKSAVYVSGWAATQSVDAPQANQ